MIETMYHLNTLDSGRAFLAALLIGAAFGFFLERAGFGSSRKLTAVFYFSDMTVIKVMFTAVMTAMLGLSLLLSFNLISLDSIYLMPTVYGAHVVGGLIFGIGFVMGGWCPGTAAAGLAAGKIDALIFLVGAVVGSALFNEFFGFIKPLYQAGQQGVLMVYDSLSIGRNGFILLMSIAAIVMFWGCEWIEKKNSKISSGKNFSVLKVMTILLLVLPLGLIIVEQGASTSTTFKSDISSIEKQLLESIDQAADHIEPAELADRLVSGDTSIILIDIRPENEFAAFHIKGAVNVSMADLTDYLQPNKNVGIIVLYSNGMTHPAQTRDSLYRNGFTNAYILTDGLNGFIEHCLKPVSLRNELLSEDMILKVNAWRSYFLSSEAASQSVVPMIKFVQPLIDLKWLEENLGKPNIKIIDLRSQPEYNTSHIPSSFSLSVENLRTNIKGMGSMLQPSDMLTHHLSLMGIVPDDIVIFIYGDKPHDATQAGMALERLGHENYTILNGGFEVWKASGKPMDTALPKVSVSNYPLTNLADIFTADRQTVLEYVKNKNAIIIDVRPSDYYDGIKSDEARAGHIPRAINRPYTEDIIKINDIQQFKSVEQLQTAYAEIIPTKETKIIVHCRTGHQASQTFFILVRLLGYKDVLWYDAGWNEWAARPELPIE